MRTATKVVARYSIATGRVRCIIHPDHDAEIPLIPIGPGEALLSIPREQRGHVHHIQGIVNAHTGKAPTDEHDRYAVVHRKTGIVKSSEYLDPLCGDTVPDDHEMVLHPIAGPGWKRLKKKGKESTWRTSAT